MDSPPENDVCSVCHERFTLPCQANCSHWFCGSCIMRVWHHGSALRPCKCPICRRLITLLIPTETAQSQRHETEASQVLENIEKYNRSFGGGSHSLMQVSKLHWDHAVTFDAASAVMFSSQILCAWSLLGLMWKCQKRLRDLPFFTRRLLREMMDPQRSLPLVFRARMIFAMIPTILYVMSPIDILPEGVFGLIGLLDDLLILLIVFLHLAAIYRSILLYRHGGH